jgi:REP element-mobilizing transposase RayT
LGRVVGGKVKLSRIGEIVKDELLKTPKIRKGVRLDEWVIMPNHMHGILIINCKSGVECGLDKKNPENLPVTVGA